MRDRVQPGTVIEGTYRITRRIGEGGMGTVYEASHARLDGRYAVKFLRPDISSRHPGAVARFRREARITSALRHPGIVQVIDFNHLQRLARVVLRPGEELRARYKLEPSD